MTEPTPYIEETKETTIVVKRSIVSRTFTILGRVIIVLVVLLGMLGVFTQTKYFRDIVLSKLTTFVDDNTNGTLTAESLDGNFFTGLTLHNVQLTLKGSTDTTPILRVGEVFTRYSIIDLLTADELPITSVILRSPDIHFVKLKGDSLWNIERLFKSRPKDPNDTAKFRMTIDLTSLRIENGKLIARDMNVAPTANLVKGKDLPPINWGDVFLDGLDLDMRAYTSGELKQRFRINNLSFLEKRSAFRLHHLEMTLNRNDEQADVEGLHISTDRSAIKISASLNPIVMLAGKPYDSLGASITKLHLQADAVNTEELTQFLPDLHFLGGTPGLIIDAEGEYGNLNITNGKLILRGSSNISFKGAIENLHKPDDFALNIDLTGRDLSDANVRTYIPGLAVGDLRRYGIVNIRRLHYEGTPTNFRTDFDIATTNGDITGKGKLDFRSKQPVYELEATSKNLNLANIIGDTAFRTNANVNLKIKGRGFNPKTAQAEFSLLSNSPSRYGRFDLSTISTSGTISGGIFKTNPTTIKFGNGGLITSKYIIVDFRGKDAVYEFSLDAENMPVAKYIPQFPASALVNVSANLQGVGASLNALQGSIDGVIRGLEYRGEKLEPVPLAAVFGRGENGTRSEQINSSIADVSVRGNYTLDQLVESIGSRVQAIMNDLARKAEGKESQLAEEIKEGRLPDSIRMSFDIHMKDLRPLDVFIPNMTLLGEGHINGSLQKHTDGTMDLDAKGNISQFLFRTRKLKGDTPSDSLPNNLSFRIFDTLRFSIEASHIAARRTSALDSLRANITIATDSTVRYNNTTISHPNIVLHYDKGSLSYIASGKFPNIVRFAALGRGDFSASTYRFPLDSLMLDFGNNFEWYSERPPIISFDSSGGIMMDTLSLFHPELGFDPGRTLAQRMKMGFALYKDTIRYAYFEAPQLKLKDVPLFITNGKRTIDPGTLNGRITNFKVNAFGALANPTINASLLLRNFIYNNVTLDSCKADLVYKNYTLTGIADLHVDTAAFSIESKRIGRKTSGMIQTNGFHVVIDSFPLMMNLAENADSKRAEQLLSNRKQSVRISGKDFPLDVFSAFLPVVTNTQGIVNVDMLLAGRQDSIQLSGKATIREGSFVIPTTSVQYDFDGALSLAGNKMSFDQFAVQNLPSDDKDGKGSVTGYVLFDGLTAKDFNVTLTTDRLTVLTSNSKESLKTVYGPLAIRTRTRPLELSGSVDAPKLSGDLTIPEANLTLPQNTTMANGADSRDILFRYYESGVNDSSVTITSDSARKEMAALTSLYDLEDRDPLIRKEEVKTGVKTDSSKARTLMPAALADLSFQDKLLFDVGLDIPGNTFVTMNLNSVASLLAEIRSEGILDITRTQAGDPLFFSGKLYVTKESSFKFFKEFKPVLGTIEFFGDITDPNLDLRAEYTGTHTTGTVDETVRILILIRGTASLPELTMELYRSNAISGSFERIVKSQDEVNADILFFLSTGSFANDLDATSQVNLTASLIGTVPQQFVNSLANSLIGSSAFRNYLRNVSFELGTNANVKLKLIGGIGDVTFRYGGDLNNPLQGDYSVELPLSAFFNFASAKNMLLQVQANTYNPESKQQTLIAPQPYVGTFEWRIPLSFGGRSTAKSNTIPIDSSGNKKPISEPQ